MGKVQRTLQEAVCILKADRIQLHYPEHPIRSGRVNLHYYHAEWESGEDQARANLGDVLSEVIVKWMCQQKKISYDREISSVRHLYAVGSLLQMGYQNAAVWGNGFAFEPGRLRGLLHRPPFRRLDIRCVRGPKTRRTLIRLGHDCPAVYGDPAVLMPLIYQPQTAEQTDYLIIPHYSQEAAARRKYGDAHILSMETDDYRSVIDRIAGSRRVISSSLHGIILAEAYGIPAVFLQDRAARLNYKYEDWYLSTGRRLSGALTSAEDGIACRLPDLDMRKITQLQEMLLESFPADLWQ